MSWPAAARIARRELRGGLRGFRIFLACLALGVAAIAGVGTVRSAIEGGLAAEGAVLLGGDAEAELTYRYATDAERAFFERIATEVSEVVDFRSMAVVERGGETERALTQVKAVDGAYPLLGAVELAPDMRLDAALAGTDDRPGAVMEPVLADRLGLAPGDTFRLGTQVFVLSARLATAFHLGTLSFSPTDESLAGNAVATVALAVTLFPVVGVGAWGLRSVSSPPGVGSFGGFHCRLARKGLSSSVRSGPEPLRLW